MTNTSVIRDVYNEFADEEYLRLTKSPLHEAEWTLTIELLEDYLGPCERILDVGAGPGRYAEYLAGKGHRVGLVDIAGECLSRFQERISAEVRGRILFTKEANATDLSWVEPATFDAALVMGPLYHLVTADERAAVLDGCRRALRTDGILLAAFVSPYQALIHPYTLPEGDRDIGLARQLLHDGITHHRGMQQWRCWPQSAQELLTSRGFEVLRTRNMEGLGCLLRNQLPEQTGTQKDTEALLDLLRLTCEVPDLIGATWHYACVARRTE